MAGLHHPSAERAFGREAVDIELADFLADGAKGPEQQALLRLIATSVDAALLVEIEPALKPCGWRRDRSFRLLESPALALVEIHHETRYLYREPVRLGAHRLLLRPRESRDVRVLANDLEVPACAAIHWSQDVAGNAVAVANFDKLASELVIVSRSRVDLGAAVYPVFDIAASALSYPFRYTDDEWTDLGALSLRRYEDAGQLEAWARGFVAATSTDTLSLLKDLNIGTCRAIIYEAREDQGTQTPAETLSRRRGSCRDIATLFIEAVRSLGFGARAVSGYLHDPTRTLLGSADAGSTHAWAEVYVPGAGWITFDPTNNALGAAHLVPVAVARDIRLALPVTGSFIGAANAFESMSVEVSVKAA